MKNINLIERNVILSIRFINYTLNLINLNSFKKNKETAAQLGNKLLIFSYAKRYLLPTCILGEREYVRKLQSHLFRVKKVGWMFWNKMKIIN